MIHGRRLYLRTLDPHTASSQITHQLKFRCEKRDSRSGEYQTLAVRNSLLSSNSNTKIHVAMSNEEFLLRPSVYTLIARYYIVAPANARTRYRY